MSEPVRMLDDPREIKAIYWSEGAAITVGGYCTRIVAYGEPGDGALVPWFAVYEGDVIKSRYRAGGLEGVAYA
jgi:hypothetical protein